MYHAIQKAHLRIRVQSNFHIYDRYQIRDLSYIDPAMA